MSSKNKTTDFHTVHVIRKDMDSSVLATGIIKPMVGAQVKVGSRISGVVKRLRTKIGDYIDKGQIIAELDDAELQAKLKQNFASLAKTQADLDYAKVNLERQRTLLRQNLISQQELDLAENAYKVASAQVSLAEANVDYAKVQLSYTSIYAPISGVIGDISTEEGETVAASLAAPTFVTIIDLNRLEVHAYVDETEIGKINVGQNATFHVDTYSETDFKGVVTVIYPKAEIVENVVNYIVTIEITDFLGKILRPEMTTFVTIFLEKRENVLAIQSNTIKRENGGKIVYVLEGTSIVKRNIKTALKDNGYTEILSGLEEGEKVVLTETTREKK